MATDSPAIESSAYTAMKPNQDTCRAVRGGTETLCGTQAAKYLPRWEAETIKDWQTRIGITFAYDAFSQAENALVGLALRHGVEIGEDVPPRIEKDWEDIDGQGTHGDIFAQYVLGDALVDGHAGILTEFPVVTPGMTLEEETALGIRAYLVRIQACQIINWRTFVYGGQQRLQLLVIREDSEEREGEFGVKAVRRYRVYRQQFRDTDRFGNPIKPFVTYQVYTQATLPGGSFGELTPGAIGEIKGPQWIPFAPVYGGQQEGLLRSRPPLLGLAHSNIRHTQVTSELSINEHVCAVPWRVITGVDPNDKAEIIISPSEVTKLGPGAEAHVLESEGVALNHFLAQLAALEKRMATQSGAMLDPDVTVPTQTATEAKIVQSQKESKLARAVRSLEDALEASFGFMAAYYGLEDGGSVTIKRDFGDFLSPDDLRVLGEARARGDLTLDTFLRVLKMSGKLPSDVDPTQEAEDVKTEMGDPSQPEQLTAEEQAALAAMRANPLAPAA